jgi:hypothetical protein
LILASGSGSVTFITARKEVKTTPLYSDLEKHDPSLFKRLNYAKEILLNMIHPSQKDSGDKENPDSGSTPILKSLEPEVTEKIHRNAARYHETAR